MLEYGGQPGGGKGRVVGRVRRIRRMGYASNPERRARR